MSLFTNQTKHGHNVHDGRGRIGNFDADLACRRAVLVHHRDYSGAARARRGWLRRVGNSCNSALLPLRSTQVASTIQKGVKVAMAVLIGLSFASPAFALDPLFDNTSFEDPDPTHFVAMTYNWKESTDPTCIDSAVYVNITNTTGQDWLIYQVQFPRASTWNSAPNPQFSTSPPLPTARIYTSSTEWTGVANSSWTPTSTFGEIFDFTSPAIIHDGQQMGLIIDNGNLAVATSTGGTYGAVGYKVGRVIDVGWGVDTGGAYSYITYNDSCGFKTTPDGHAAFTPSFKLFGYGADLDEGGSGSTSTNPIPSSTYDGTFSGSTPSLSWSVSGTPSISATYFSQKFVGMFGATSSFPMCVVDPFVNLIDVIRGATLGDQPSASIVMAGAMGAGTSTFSLTSASSVAASIGLKNITDLLFPFMQACAWLGFGIYVFRSLIVGDEPDETL